MLILILRAPTDDRVLFLRVNTGEVLDSHMKYCSKIFQIVF